MLELKVNKILNLHNPQMFFSHILLALRLQYN